MGGLVQVENTLAPSDLAAFVRSEPASGLNTLHLIVEGVHCGACVRRIERALERSAGPGTGRVNLTTRRLTLRWPGDPARAAALAATVTRLGYRVVPFDPERLGALESRTETELLWAMGVAGFAAGNVMLLAFAVWGGYGSDMGPATRTLFHWIEALIALPAVAWAGLPFYRSAARALAAGLTNMDVPISLGVLVTTAMSLFQTNQGAEHAYFDSAVTLLFLLLVGRYLDRRARGSARSAAERLLALGAVPVTRLLPDGTTRAVRPEQIRIGDRVLVATGGRIGVDGTLQDAAAELDTSLITGETLPQRVAPGEPVFAGTINLGPPLRLAVRATGEGTLLAEIVRLMELAEQKRGRFVALADRAARLYAPVVHTLALLTFFGWVLLSTIPWQVALLYAVAVLIITCPCALGLAVPAVQVIASGRLMRRGVLVKSATALERLAEIDMVVFDKTGTLTDGRPELVRAGVDAADRRAAAALAKASRHPLARALGRACPDVAAAQGVEEVAGQGLRMATPEGEVRLGRRGWAADIAEEQAVAQEGIGPELWLTRPGRPPVRFAFADRLRDDAAAVIRDLRARGLHVALLSGDRMPAVRAAAEALGIEQWRAACSPAEKVARLEELARAGRRVLMVGDGLNDAPALAAAHASISPASAIDISQTAADAVFQGARLAPVATILEVAHAADRLVRQNFALAFVYNVLAVPFAIAGLVTPLIAAVAMSASSLAVVGNAMRLQKSAPGPQPTGAGAGSRSSRATTPSRSGAAAG
ncbi:MAG TPA: heavy metal translocating P-type ATPase [Geminicoccaceae bacterium]|nr:heavy metal translocating P-type ATPase [Geminicoccaceae bacterium]